MWNIIKINKSQIEHETDKATLIKLPSSSDLSGWAFWHPSKLVRELQKGNGYIFSVSFTEEWEFKLVKLSRNNKAQMKASAESILDAFSKQIEHQKTSDESYIVVEEPKKVTKNIEVSDELRREG